MSFQTMSAEIKGFIPKMSYDFSKTLINRAWKDVRRQNLWSFQVFTDQWISPAIIQAGTCSVTTGSPIVTMDATAAAAINASSATYSLITQRQFRIFPGGIYSIIGWDGATLLTLDRPYGEATVTGQEYTIYQPYYAAPMEDFLMFLSVRDMRNFIPLRLTRTQAEVNKEDPQRTIFFFPTDVIPWQQDQNPSSTTYRYPMFELWGAPFFTTPWNWQLYGLRKGTDLALPTDTLPPAVGEDCVLALARQYAYEWAEANKGDIPRNQGTDFRFLIGEAKSDYNRLFRDYRRQDRNTINNWDSVRQEAFYARVPYYSTQSGTASTGGFLW